MSKKKDLPVRRIRLREPADRRTGELFDDPDHQSEDAGKHTAALLVRFTPAELLRLTKRARRELRSAAGLVRQAVSVYLGRKGAG